MFINPPAEIQKSLNDVKIVWKNVSSNISIIFTIAEIKYLTGTEKEKRM